MYGHPVKIGILGGIGPEATARFYEDLFRRLQQRGVQDNTSYPQIIVNSIPAPELVGTEISDDKLRPYKTGLKDLAGLGVDFIAMVCNTVHLYRDELQGEINVPIIDLRERVREHLIKNGVKKMAVLGTRPTIERGLYYFPGIENVPISSEDIQMLDDIIVKYNSESKTSQRHVARDIAKKYLDKGAETVVLGCTELAVMLKDMDIPKIDTMDVLVDAVIENGRNQGATIEQDRAERKRRAMVQYCFENICGG